MTIWAALAGHEFDLGALARQFPTGDPRIVINDEGSFMLSNVLDDVFEDAGRLVTAAQDQLDQLNGWCTYQDAAYRHVRLQARFRRGGEHNKDQRVEHVVVTDEARARDNVTIVMPEVAVARAGAESPTVTGGDLVEPPAPPGPSVLALNNPNVRDLLAILGKSEELSWAQLYKCFEIIRDAVGGGRKGVYRTGWTTERELSRFTGTADHPAASGIHEGRHARQSGPPPTRTMSLDEGQTYIRDLARHWLTSLT